MTTAPAVPSDSGREGVTLDRRHLSFQCGFHPNASALVSGALLATLVLVAAVALLVIGCEVLGEAVPSASQGVASGGPWRADLDGDGDEEEVVLHQARGYLVILDGDVIYRTRAKWRVAQALIGDTDFDGLPEVVALVDADDGRHLALFAYFGGKYRERLVTREIMPRPAGLGIIDPRQAWMIVGPEEASSIVDGQPRSGIEGALVVLSQEPLAAGAEPRQIVLRWNGFGFTRVGTVHEP